MEGVNMNTNLLPALSIEYLKSYLSINSMIGCSVNCAYCFLAPIEIVPMHPIRVIGEKELVSTLLNHPLFVNGKTILSLNNRTDPFISNQVKESTFRVLEELEAANVKSVVTMTTKGLLTDFDVRRLESLNLKLVIIVTYNEIPMNIQPIPSYIQVSTMQNVASSKHLKLLHQFRPIIPQINDSAETIENVLSVAHQYCAASIYQGVRISEQINNRLRERGYIFYGAYDKHKQKSPEVDRIMQNYSRSKFSDYPIFDHTSCCLSYLLQLPDYNLHYKKRNCPNSCKNYERCHTAHIKIPDKKDIETDIKRLGISCKWEFCDNSLQIRGILNDEQRSYFRHTYGLNVTSTVRSPSFSEQFID